MYSVYQSHHREVRSTGYESETYCFFFISYGTANLQFPDKKILT